MNSGNGLGSLPDTTTSQEYLQRTTSLNWEEYKKWLFSNKQKSYADKLFKNTLKVWKLGFSNELITMPQNRAKLEVLKCVGNLTRFIDITNDTNFHEQFTLWLKRKEIHWNTQKSIDTYALGKRLDIKDIVSKLKELPPRYRNYGLFVLVSGLRTSEALPAFNHHDKLCNNGVMELFWDRKTKKANAVFCHPLLHKKINHTISRKVYYHITKKNLGFYLRDLRKVNFTMVATKIDPLLAEFMQGRRGNVSQKHYFLPLMNNNKRKWVRIWEPIIKKLNIENS